MVDAPVDEEADVLHLRYVGVDGGMEVTEDGDLKPFGLEPVAVPDRGDLADAVPPAADHGGRAVDPQLGSRLEGCRDGRLVESAADQQRGRAPGRGCVVGRLPELGDHQIAGDLLDRAGARLAGASYPEGDQRRGEQEGHDGID